MVDIATLRARLKQASSNPELQAELRKSGISVSDIDSMSSEQIKTLMSPKMMGMLGMSKEDLDTD